MKKFISLALTLAMLLSSFAFAAPMAPVAVESAGEAVETALPDEGVELAGTTAIPTPEFRTTEVDVSNAGSLVYYEDFSGYEVGDVIPNDTALSWFDADFFETQFEPKLNGFYGTDITFEVVDLDGNKAVKVYSKNATTGNHQPVIALTGNKDVAFNEYAEFTSVYDFMLPSDSLFTQHQHRFDDRNDNTSYSGVTYTLGAEVTADTWKTTKRTIRNTVDNKDWPLTIVRIIGYKAWDGSYTSEQIFMYLDNLAMFAKKPKTTTPPSTTDGDAVYFETFEGYNVGDTLTLGSAFDSTTAVLNSDVSYMAYYSLYGSNYSAEVVYDPAVAEPTSETNKVLKITQNKDSQYATSQVCYEPLSAEGTYKSVAKFYAPEGTSITAFAADFWDGGTRASNYEKAPSVGNWVDYSNVWRVDADSAKPTNILYYGRAGAAMTPDVSVYYIDDIGVYFQGPPTVTFDSTGASSVPAPFVGNKITLSDYTANSADPVESFLGWSYTAGGAVITDVTLNLTADITLYPVFGTPIRDNTTHTEYGKLLMYEDFQARENNFEVVGNGGNAAIGWFDNEFLDSISDNPDWNPSMNWNQGSSKMIMASESNGNKYMKTVYEDGYVFKPYPDFATGIQYSQFAISIPNLTKPGIYTVIADMRADSATDFSDSGMEAAFRMSMYNSTGGHTPGSAITPSTSWQTVKATKTVDGTSITDVRGPFFYAQFKPLDGAVLPENVEFHIDNFAMYYQPFSTITFDANGVEADVPAATLFQTATVDLASYIPSPKDTTIGFLGWSETPDGNVIKGEYQLTGDKTLYAIWGAKKIHPLLSIEFNSPDDYATTFSTVPAGLSVTHNVDADGTAYITYAVNTVHADPLTTWNIGQAALYENIKGLEMRVRTNNNYTTKGDGMKFYHAGTDHKIQSDAQSFSGTITAKPNEWQICYIDLSKLRDNYNDINVLRWDPFPNNTPAGQAYDIDYIRFILDDTVTVNTSASVADFTITAGADGDKPISDYRSGIFNVTFNNNVFDMEGFKKMFFSGTAADLFSADSITFDGVDTYTFSAKAPLAGKTWNSPSEYTEISGRVDYEAGFIYKFVPQTFNDGENLIPNGDFYNDFYNPWVGSTLSRQLANGELKVTFDTAKNAWQNVQIENIKFKPNTKYFYNVSVRYDNELGISFTEDANQTAAKTFSFYAPFQDGLFDGSTADMNTVQSGGLFMGTKLNGKDIVGVDINKQGIINIFDEALYSTIARKDSETSYTDGDKWGASLDELGGKTGITYQEKYFFLRAGSWRSSYNKLFTDGGNMVILSDLGDLCANDKLKSEYEGLSFYITKAVLKEMFPVAVAANGATGSENLYFAKGEAVKIPETTLVYEGAIFEGYMINNTLYTPGQFFTATEFNQNITVEAVWAMYQPTLINKAEIRPEDADHVTGMRYQATVTLEVSELADEYGFIITRKELLGDVAAADFTHASGIKYVEGKNKVNGNEIVLEINEVDNFKRFSGVLINMKVDQYDDVFVGRPYVKVGEEYYYGAPIATSIYDVAFDIYENSSDISSPEYLAAEEIVGAVEG